MAIKKKGGKLEDNTKKTAKSIGKTVVKSQLTTNKNKGQALKGTKKMVNKIAHSAEKMLEQASKTGKKVEKTTAAKEPGANRFRATDKKSIVESVGVLAEEIRLYIDENEEIGVSKLLGVMKSRGNGEAMIFAAMGWLLRDRKITISPDGKKVSLH
ncbi:MAG: hypothetical protein HGA96_14605 [Desulfobulbaceae bacterium]|nr:hypothetical protein [Desulfobulbaceae bacterium]